MCAGPTGHFGESIDAARRGDPVALGRLAEQVRDYLLLVANQELSPALQRKIGPSDLVQETFLLVQRNLGQFRGNTEQELLAWARAILLNNIHDVQRSYRAQRRDAAREQPLGGDSALGIAPAEPPADTIGPGAAVVARETSDALQRAIQRLPDEYRQVLRLRTWERLSFAEVGQRMARSADAARMLWNRAVRQLQENMGSEHDSR
jgi:RNA polymerase sigma-70 factor (ECF subfamily)